MGQSMDERIPMSSQDSAQSEKQPTYDELMEIAKAAIRFHQSLMSDWAAPRPESDKTMKLSDALEKAYFPHFPL
jgi:hypothetical protein